ncbi:MAG: hypothetical protein RJA81_25 [Planctomycetota bacterium]
MTYRKYRKFSIPSVQVQGLTTTMRIFREIQIVTGKSMIDWGEFPKKRTNLWPTRNRETRISVGSSMFVPVQSHQAAIRYFSQRLSCSKALAVLHGPAGSGRSTVAYQIIKMLGKRSKVWRNPPRHCSESLLFEQIDQRIANQGSKTEFLVIDSLTTRHTGWLPMLGFLMNQDVQVLIVSSTSWFFQNRVHFDREFCHFGLKLLDPSELEHLANGVRWSKKPGAAALNSDQLSAINLESEGQLNAVVHLAECAEILASVD